MNPKLLILLLLFMLIGCSTKQPLDPNLGKFTGKLDKFTIPKKWANSKGKTFNKTFKEYTTVCHDKFCFLAHSHTTLTFRSENNDWHFQVGVTFPAYQRRGSYFFVSKEKKVYDTTPEEFKARALRRGCVDIKKRVGEKWPLHRCYREVGERKFYQYSSIMREGSDYVVVGSILKDRLERDFKVIEYALTCIRPRKSKQCLESPTPFRFSTI